jgi:hypothetical protein
MSLFDACLMMEQAGRRLAAAPLAEAVVTLRVLGELGGDRAARQWIDKVRDGKTILVLALQQARSGESQLVPGGAVAQGILTFDGREVAIEVPGEPLAAPSTLGGAALGVFVPGRGERHVIGSSADAQRIWAAGIEEWKLLTAAALIGLSREALGMAAAYATQRIAFGQPIGANQGIAHPLADDVIDADGAAMLLWWTLARDGGQAPGGGGDGIDAVLVDQPNGDPLRRAFAAHLRRLRSDERIRYAALSSPRQGLGAGAGRSSGGTGSRRPPSATRRGCEPARSRAGGNRLRSTSRWTGTRRGNARLVSAHPRSEEAYSARSLLRVP